MFVDEYLLLRVAKRGSADTQKKHSLFCLKSKLVTPCCGGHCSLFFLLAIGQATPLSFVQSKYLEFGLIRFFLYILPTSYPQIIFVLYGAQYKMHILYLAQPGFSLKFHVSY